jgi:predicted DCC family thiol-disulfide oxidoreductase YuxK
MKPVIFYDGSCDLCRREIAHYRRLDTQYLIEWVDIVAHPQRLASADVDYVEAMAVLHGLDEDGHLVTGVANFMMIWARLPGYRWLAKLLAFLRLQSSLQWMYLHFARWRFNRRMRKGCQLP